MTDYKRLTTKRANGVFSSFDGSYKLLCKDCRLGNKPHCLPGTCQEILAERLGKLEDKIENGTLRELPKIGQTLYGVIPWRKEVREITIDNIGVFSDCIVVFDTYDNDYVLNDYAFYTEAEAQKKLKECKK